MNPYSLQCEMIAWNLFVSFAIAGKDTRRRSSRKALVAIFCYKPDGAHIFAGMSIQFKERKQPLLEKFGVYYLDLFRKKDLTHHPFDLPDTTLAARVGRITAKGILLSALVGLVCVWPTVYIGVIRQQEPWYIQYSWVGGVTLVSVLIEFYLLFLIALRAVHEVSELINMRAHDHDFLQSGPFSITNILSRAALEIQDPDLHILGIDPFKRVSKKNLLLLGLLYKCKIILTNFVARWLLLHTVGPTIGGISIYYIALPVECFWNGVVIRRVVKEARLRLFGFALCNHIADHLLQEKTLQRLSEQARTRSEERRVGKECRSRWLPYH